MKKTIWVSALVLVALIGVGTGAYLFYEYNDHKPLILKCIISASPDNSSRVGVSYFWQFTPSGDLPEYGSEYIGTPQYWSFAEEDWSAYGDSVVIVKDVGKNRFAWRGRQYGLMFEMQIDRLSGDFSVSEYDDDPALGCWFESCTVKALGNCTQSVKPAKTLKQKF